MHPAETQERYYRSIQRLHDFSLDNSSVCFDLGGRIGRVGVGNQDGKLKLLGTVNSSGKPTSPTEYCTSGADNFPPSDFVCVGSILAAVQLTQFPQLC